MMTYSMQNSFGQFKSKWTFSKLLLSLCLFTGAAKWETEGFDTVQILVATALVCYFGHKFKTLPYRLIWKRLIPAQTVPVHLVSVFKKSPLSFKAKMKSDWLPYDPRLFLAVRKTSLGKIKWSHSWRHCMNFSEICSQCLFLIWSSLAVNQ